MNKSININNIPKPPELQCRIIREGVGRFCSICGSTISKNKFFGLFGELLCHNSKCPNSTKKK